MGSLDARSTPTGWRCLKLSPRFPFKALPIHITYCIGKLLSKWYCAVRDARVSSLILRPLVIEPIGSEGVKRIRKKITTDTTRSIGTSKRSRFKIYLKIKFIFNLTKPYQNTTEFANVLIKVFFLFFSCQKTRTYNQYQVQEQIGHNESH